MAVIEVIPHIVIVPHVEIAPHPAPVEPRMTEPAPQRSVPIILAPHPVPSVSGGTGAPVGDQPLPLTPIVGVMLLTGVIVAAYLIYTAAWRARRRSDRRSTR